jgi:LysR family transcriptional regulator, hydrogen peroxide-inducible genes activator
LLCIVGANDAMNLRDLEYAVAVADHGGFSRAAAACNVSQPTLSGQIMKLEAELGLRLFERDGRTVRVEAGAAAVIAEARAALAAAANVTAIARAARDPFAGPLRVGVIATVAPYLLPFALPAATQALPRTPLRLIEDLTDRLMALMIDGELDAAIIASDPQSRRFAAIRLYEEPFFWVAAETGRTPKRKTIGVDEIDGRSLLLLSEGHCLRDQALALCGAAKGPSGADVRAMSLETIRHLVAARQGSTLAPLLAFANWRRQSADLEGLRVVGRGASRLVRLVLRRSSPRRAALDALAASLRDSAKQALVAGRAEAQGT